MWDADSLLSDPAVSDYLGEEPTISATDHEDFGKKVSEMVVQSSITHSLFLSWSNAFRRAENGPFGPWYRGFCTYTFDV